ncbi:hypothetical protein D3C86_1128840 [compost metagenome]
MLRAELEELVTGLLVLVEGGRVALVLQELVAEQVVVARQAQLGGVAQDPFGFERAREVLGARGAVEDGPRVVGVDAVLLAVEVAELGLEREGLREAEGRAIAQVELLERVAGGADCLGPQVEGVPALEARRDEMVPGFLASAQVAAHVEGVEAADHGAGLEGEGLLGLPGDEVDDPAHGLRAVEGRRGAAHDLDALELGGREAAEVDHPVVAAADALAVHEDQDVLGVEALDADPLAELRAGHVEAHVGAQKLGGAPGAGGLDLGAADHLGGDRRVAHPAFGAGAGHDDLVQAVHVVLGACARGLGEGGGDREHGAEREERGQVPDGRVQALGAGRLR